jgi:hypothetical protein
MRRYRGGVRLAVIGALWLVGSACAVIPRLEIAYVMIPGGVVSEKGSSIGLRVKDARKDKSILGPGAKLEFQGNLETASLQVGPPFGELSPAGVFDVPGLMREAFRRKLEAVGLKPVMGLSDEIPGLVVVVREFVLDVDGRDWTGSIAYEAKLQVGGEMKFSRSVEGSAKRLKLVGRADAEKLMGELFTDCINRLDLLRFFDLADIALP